MKIRVLRATSPWLAYLKPRETMRPLSDRGEKKMSKSLKAGETELPRKEIEYHPVREWPRKCGVPEVQDVSISKEQEAPCWVNTSVTSKGDKGLTCHSSGHEHV